MKKSYDLPGDWANWPARLQERYPNGWREANKLAGLILLIIVGAVIIAFVGCSSQPLSPRLRCNHVVTIAVDSASIIPIGCP